MIYLITGPIGAGKSTYSRKLAEQTNSVIFSIDEWMEHLYGPDISEPIDLNWIMPRVSRCETLIWSTAVRCAQNGHHVILDIGLMKAAQRIEYCKKANELGLAYELRYLDTATPIRLQRVMKRNADKGDTFSFEVTPEMFQYMDAQFEIPTTNECENLFCIST